MLAVIWGLQAFAQIDVSGEQTSNPIVDRLLKILLAPWVVVGRQNRGMAEEKLNLLRFASIDVTQLRTCSPQIVRREMVKLHSLGTIPICVSFLCYSPGHGDACGPVRAELYCEGEGGGQREGSGGAKTDHKLQKLPGNFHSLLHIAIERCTRYLGIKDLLADAADLKSQTFSGRGGSSPPPGTIESISYIANSVAEGSPES